MEPNNEDSVRSLSMLLRGSNHEGDVAEDSADDTITDNNSSADTLDTTTTTAPLTSDREKQSSPAKPRKSSMIKRMTASLPINRKLSLSNKDPPSDKNSNNRIINESPTKTSTPSINFLSVPDKARRHSIDTIRSGRFETSPVLDPSVFDAVTLSVADEAEEEPTDDKPQRKPRVTFSKEHDTVDVDIIETDDITYCEKAPTSPTSIASQCSVDSENTKMRRRQCKTKIFISILFVIMVTGVALVVRFYEFKEQKIAMGQKFLYDKITRKIFVYDDVSSNETRTPVLTGNLGVNLNPEKLPAFCKHKQKNSEICLIWKDLATLDILFHNESNDVNCYDVTWQSTNPDVLLQDCFRIDDALWFGMGLTHEANWPLNKHQLDKTPFLIGSMYDEDSFGPVLEPLWLSSKGVSIAVFDDVPLHISMNRKTTAEDNATFGQTDNQLCLYADYKNSPYQSTSLPHLSYTICVGENTAAVLNHTSKNYPIPSPPSIDILKDPVWSVSPYLDCKNLTQDALQNYVSSLHGKGFPHSAFVLNCPWESAPGDFQFHPERFPNPQGMINNITGSGFELYLLAHPYLSFNSMAFQYGIKEELLVLDQSGQVPGLTQWYPGPVDSVPPVVSAVTDLNPDGYYYLQAKLMNLTNTFNISSFSWVGGQTDMLPIFPSFGMNFSTPNEYLTHLAMLGTDISGRNQILQSGYNTQGIPGLLALHGLTSTWGPETGLASLIPRVLTIGILGYPFTLPETIGGSDNPDPASKELYIRWLQLSAFMPVMHFSTPPFFYDEQVINISKQMIHIHQTITTPVIEELTAEEFYPLIRPLFLDWPQHNESYVITDQFTVGGKYLVAPVLRENQRSRDIYLPQGCWDDQITKKILFGPYWIRNYPANISVIPHFKSLCYDTLPPG